MARGPKKHLKRLAAPKHWMLDKLGGIFAPKPRAGPHKASQCLPLVLIIRNRLKYALNYREAMMILKQRFLKVDGKVRTDPKFPAGFMDVIQIKKTGDKFRLLYDTKGRFILHRLPDKAETRIKLCKVVKISMAKRSTPYCTTHDGRTIRFPDPNLKRHDSVVINLETGKIKEWVRCKPGCMVMVTAGSNTGRIGELVRRERHPGSFDIIHIKDAADNKFATRLDNVFVIGSSIYHPLISLPKQKGIRLSIAEDRERKLAMNEKKKQAKKQKPKKTGGKKSTKKGKNSKKGSKNQKKGKDNKKGKETKKSKEPKKAPAKSAKKAPKKAAKAAE
jgi:small subunit ribosomal protein S4e